MENSKHSEPTLIVTHYEKGTMKPIGGSCSAGDASFLEAGLFVNTKPSVKTLDEQFAEHKEAMHSGKP